MASLPLNMPPISGVNAILNAHSTSQNTSSIKPTALSLFSMHTKVAVVTGAGRGIGLEIALAYAEAGAHVYCLDLLEKPLEEWGVCKAWVDGLPGEGGKGKGSLEYTQCDVTQQRATWDLVARIAEKEGRLDVCVACAGVLRGSEVLEWDGEDWEKLMKVNVSGVLFTAQAAGRQMASRGIKGSIILIASMSARITNPVSGTPSSFFTVSWPKPYN
jgi:NAD(P)-dependent dehydrogenase (short-subunit alcohol dehydrogenase family)